MATHPPVTPPPPQALAGSAPASPGNRPSVSLKQLLTPRPFHLRGNWTKVASLCHKDIKPSSFLTLNPSRLLLLTQFSNLARFSIKLPHSQSALILLFQNLSPPPQTIFHRWDVHSLLSKQN